MPFQVTASRFPQYVRYNAAGQVSLKSLVDFFAGIVADTDQYEDDRVLLDLREVQGRLTPEEQILVGEVLGRQLPFMFKLSLLVPAGEMTPNTERGAMEYGLRLKVFQSEVDAIAWMLDGKPA